jgi:hypothetical protein
VVARSLPRRLFYSGWFLPEAHRNADCNLAPKNLLIQKFATKLIGVTRLARRKSALTARS